jgi:hypothetical protein
MAKKVQAMVKLQIAAGAHFHHVFSRDQDLADVFL